MRDGWRSVTPRQRSSRDSILSVSRFEEEARSTANERFAAARSDCFSMALSLLFTEVG